LKKNARCTVGTKQRTNGSLKLSIGKYDRVKLLRNSVYGATLG